MGELGSKLLASITNLLNDIICSGKVPEFARPYFYGAKLLALSKPNGGIRPIAVGNTLR